MFRGGIYTDSWESNKLQNSHYACLKRAAQSKLRLFFFGPSSQVHFAPPPPTGFDITQHQIYVVQFMIFLNYLFWCKHEKTKKSFDNTHVWSRI